MTIRQPDWAGCCTGRCCRGGRYGGGCGLRRWLVERPLAIGDLQERLIERRRRSGGQTRPLALGIEVGDRALDSLHALLDLAFGGVVVRDQLVELVVELGDDVGELARRLILAARGLRHCRLRPRDRFELPLEVVEAVLHLGKALVGRRQDRSRLIGAARALDPGKWARRARIVGAIRRPAGGARRQSPAHPAQLFGAFDIARIEVARRCAPGWRRSALGRRVVLLPARRLRPSPCR